jgi:phospholipid/cholesterol/gamma-HCH transport system permease protein
MNMMKKIDPVAGAKSVTHYWVKSVLDFFTYTGGVMVLLARTVFHTFAPPIRKWSALEQMQRIGVSSLPIIFLISLFTGMVIALQSAYQMQKVGAEMYIASLVSLSITRELGPVLTALIVAGRCGASITAEIGTMLVTEQIDALETLSANPIKYLIVPRFLALVVMVPLLTIYADFFGILGGYLIGVGKLGISHSMYWKMTYDPLAIKDVTTGLFKSLTFGIIICMISCFEGLNSEGGAEGVGKATTESVVKSFILVIVADCFITALFYFIIH